MVHIQKGTGQPAAMPTEAPSGLSFPTPEDLLDPGIEPRSLASPALAGEFFITEPPGKPKLYESW